MPKQLSREQIRWETTQRQKVFTMVDEFIDDIQNDHMVIHTLMTSKQRHDVHEYVKSKELLTKTIEIPGSQYKKIVVFRSADRMNIDDNVTILPNVSIESDIKSFDHNDISFFIDYTGIPIPVTDFASIDYFLDLYDDMYDAKNKWIQFINESKHMNLRNETQRVKKLIIDHITGCQKFIDLTKQKIFGPTNLLRKEPYSLDKVGKYFISIDIRAGNFTVLRDAVPEIFLDKDNTNLLNWCEYVKKFTDSKFITESKLFREIVFGLLPGYMSKARILQELLMDNIYNIIKQSDTDNILTLTMKQGDELIYEIKDFWNTMGSDDHNLSINNIISLLKNHESKLHFRVYELNSITDRPWFYKTWIYNDGIPGNTVGTMVEFKSVPRIFKAQVMKWYQGIPIDHNDLLFTHEGLKARFEHPIFTIYS